MWPLLVVVLSVPVPLEAPAAPAWGSLDAGTAAVGTRVAEVGWASTRRADRMALLRRASRTVRHPVRNRTRRTRRRAEHRSPRAVDADASLRVQRGAAVARRVARRTRRAHTPQRIAPSDPHPPAV